MPSSAFPTVAAVSFRDHLIAAALAIGVMAASLMIGRSPDLAAPPTDATPLAIAPESP